MYTGENIRVIFNQYAKTDSVDSKIVDSNIDDKQEGIAELIFDVNNSRVNIFNSQTVRELSEALSVIESSSTINGLLIRSAKPAFIAGADIHEFAPVFAQGADKIRALLQRSTDNFNRIESLPFPVVAAINGFALGGGCEMVLACDYRIASDDLRMGLPETRLGIIPGWGGTVRLPRIAGIETAVEWITTGKEHAAWVALEQGVIDGVVSADQLPQAALQTLRQCMAGKLDYSARRQQKNAPLAHNAIEKNMAFLTCKAMVAAQAGRHYPAPLMAVEVIEAAAGLQRDDALLLEANAFIDLAQTSVALSLSGIFVSEQYVSKKARLLAKESSHHITQAAVLGAGIMGGGIAYQSALKHIPIIMKDVQVSGVQLGLEEARKLLNKRVEKGRLSVIEMGETLNRIDGSLHYEGFEAVDIVVEAVIENPDIKSHVLAEVEQYVSCDTILASNTSTISIDLLAQKLARPENFCGMHFFNPVHAMPLVEVIKGVQTSPQTIAATVSYANALGKKAIVVKDCPGFLVNRVLFPYFAAFSMLIRDGVDFQRIDKIMELWGWPMGPAYLLDVVGIDTCVHAADVMAEGYPSRMSYDFTSAAQAMFDAQRLGQKNTLGFYDYGVDKKGKPTKTVSQKSLDVLATCVSTDAAVIKANEKLSDEDIIDRMMIPMATELARCLEEGIVESVEEADMALVYGLGFPPFRGGVFRWIDSVGVDVFCEKATAYAGLGEMYRIPDGMSEMRESESSYYSLQSSPHSSSNHNSGKNGVAS